MDNRTKAVVVVILVLAAGASVVVLISPGPTSSKAQGPPLNCPTSINGSAASVLPGLSASGDWTTYHGSNSRSGFEPSNCITAVHPQRNGSFGLDGQVYAEPLVDGSTVFVATENNSVYAVNAASGSLLWRTHLGTPVDGSTLPCGDINPSGITGTPVIDTAAGIIYVVAFLSPAQHVLYGLNVADGVVRSHVVVDPAGADPTVEQERGALALANGFVYIPYGGLAGDCGQYHGWVVGAPISGSTTLIAYQVPTGREGGIWAPAGVTVAPNGNLYVATGNGASTTTYDYGDAVIELSPSLNLLDYFAPTNWAQLNAQDLDLGSVAPTLLPNGDVFQIGKDGIGYLVSGTHLGGIGGQLYSAPVCSGAYGGTARVGQSVFLPCQNGIVAITVGVSSFTVDWGTSSFGAGPPIVTGNIVWAVDSGAGNLLGFNISNGKQVFQLTLGSADRFITPAATSDAVFVAAGDQLLAYSLS